MNHFNSINIIKFTKIILLLTTTISIVLELLFFPSIETFVGCLMMGICCFAFSKFVVKRYYIVYHPFSFSVMVSMFAYRFFPVPGTLLSFRPVTYGMKQPIKTFIYETIFFLLFIIVFKLSCQDIRHSIVRTVYKKLGLFDGIDEFSIWIIGLIGFITGILIYFIGEISINGIISSFANLMYAPIVLFFPFLYQKKYIRPVNLKKIKVWFYVAAITIINFGSNSREKTVKPFVIIALVYFLYMVVGKQTVNMFLRPKRIIFFLAIIVTLTVAIQNISDAMLAVRSYREDVSSIELIKQTADYARNSREYITPKTVNEVEEYVDYSDGWNEEYINNFLLNRYGNIRISDEVFYMSNALSSSDMKELRKDLGNRLLCLLPQPIINFLGIELRKSDYNYSTGDYFYYKTGYGNSYSLGSRRVTSYLPDGLATFGMSYIFIHMASFWILFILLKGLVDVDNKGCPKYSVFGILSIISIHNLGMNTNGIYNVLSFIMRGLYEQILIYAVIAISINTIRRLITKRPRDLKNNSIELIN